MFFGSLVLRSQLALCLADAIRRNPDLDQMAGAIYINLPKALDTVHDLLLSRLSNIGVTN